MPVSDFNSYGSRRGNHEVMVRGTFANIRLKNKLAPGTEGGVTRHLPDGEVMSIFDASEKYREEGVPLIILAGKEYGSGSSRDWAAKGPKLLGIRAVIAESYERIHRSNLVGMGILPLQFGAGDDVEQPRPDRRGGLRHRGAGRRPGRRLQARQGGDGRRRPSPTATEHRFTATVRIDTPQEIRYYQHGGILALRAPAIARRPEATALTPSDLSEAWIRSDGSRLLRAGESPPAFGPSDGFPPGSRPRFLVKIKRLHGMVPWSALLSRASHGGPLAWPTESPSRTTHHLPRCRRRPPSRRGLPAAASFRSRPTCRKRQTEAKPVVSKNQAIGWLRQMLLIRRFEEQSDKLYQMGGKIGGFCHLYSGQEPVAVGSIGVLREDDYVITAYRDHGHALARGMGANEAMAELLGRLHRLLQGQGRLDALLRRREGVPRRPRHRRQPHPARRGRRLRQQVPEQGLGLHLLLRRRRDEPGVAPRGLQHGQPLEAPGDLRRREQHDVDGHPAPSPLLPDGPDRPLRDRPTAFPATRSTPTTSS